MKKLALILLTAAALNVFAAETKVQGYLVDLACSREEGQNPGFGAGHSKMCLQMPECVKSGYGVLTDDKKVIKFDAPSNPRPNRFIPLLNKPNTTKLNC